MITTMTVRQEFPAAHHIEGHPTEGQMHGHTFKVEVTILHDPAAHIGDVDETDLELDMHVAAILSELAGRDMDKMIPASITNPWGVAAWIWERLALKYKLYEVTVWQDDVAGSVRRER